MGHKYKLIILSALLILNLIIIPALGVNSPYWQGNPLKIRPGETKDVSFPLENSVNEKTTEATVSLIEGGEIAQIISGEKYIVEPGNKDKNIILRINISQNAKLGDKHNVNFSVQYSPAEGSGNVQLNVKYNVDFPVEVSTETVQNQLLQKQTENQTGGIEKTTKSSSIFFIIIVLVIILAIILTAVIIRLKHKN